MNSFIRKIVPVSDCTVEKKSSSDSQLMTQECDMPVSFLFVLAPCRGGDAQQQRSIASAELINELI